MKSTEIFQYIVQGISKFGFCIRSGNRFYQEPYPGRVGLAQIVFVVRRVDSNGFVFGSVSN